MQVHRRIRLAMFFCLVWLKCKCRTERLQYPFLYILMSYCVTVSKKSEMCILVKCRGLQQRSLEFLMSVDP